MKILKGLLLAGLATHAAASYAVTFSGYVNDAANPALVHADLEAALFGDRSIRMMMGRRGGWLN